MENYHKELIIKNVLTKDDLEAPPVPIQFHIPRPYHSRIKALAARDEITTGNAVTLRAKTLEALIRGILILEREDQDGKV